MYTSSIMLIRFGNVCVFSVVEQSEWWFLLDCRRFLGHWRWDGAQRNHSNLLSEAKAGLDRSQKPPPASLTSDLSLTDTGGAVMADANKSQNFIFSKFSFQWCIMGHSKFTRFFCLLLRSEVKGNQTMDFVLTSLDCNNQGNSWV